MLYFLRKSPPLQLWRSIFCFILKQLIGACITRNKGKCDEHDPLTIRRTYRDLQY